MTYIGGVAALCTVEVIILVLTIRYFFHPDKTGIIESNCTRVGRSTLTGLWPHADMILFALRVAGFLWFFCFAWIGRWIYRATEGTDPPYWYFTVWNIILLGFYFLLASICSWQHYIDPNGSSTAGFPSWYTPERRRLVGSVTSMVYDVAGSNALFVTLVAFTVLDSSGRFWNIANHLSNSLFILGDTVLNDLDPKPFNLQYSLIWLYAYTCFVWIIVDTDTREWPYNFMKVDEASAFFVYTVLLVLNILLYLLWLLVAGKLKGLVLLRAGVTMGTRYSSGIFCCFCVRTAASVTDQEDMVMTVELGGISSSPAADSASA